MFGLGRDRVLLPPSGLWWGRRRRRRRVGSGGALRQARQRPAFCICLWVLGGRVGGLGGCLGGAGSFSSFRGDSLTMRRGGEGRRQPPPLAHSVCVCLCLPHDVPSPISLGKMVGKGLGFGWSMERRKGKRIRRRGCGGKWCVCGRERRTFLGKRSATSLPNASRKRSPSRLGRPFEKNWGRGRRCPYTQHTRREYKGNAAVRETCKAP